MNALILKNSKNDYLAMMSAPDHTALSSPNHDYTNTPFSSENTADSAYLCMSPSCQMDESGIFSPRPHQNHSHFNFPPLASNSEAVELSPMLKYEKDPYLKPINIQAQRAEFVRQKQTIENQISDRSINRDSGYVNSPQNLHLIDLNDADNELARQNNTDEYNSAKKINAGENDVKKKDFVPTIIHTQNNYINMPKQKSDLRKDMPDSFSNPSYVINRGAESLVS